MVIRAVSLILVMIISTSCTSRSTRSQTRQSHDSQRLFTANGHQFQPLIAHDDDDRARGLQYRQPPADGLILLFPRSSRQSIWMPNCPVDLEGWIIDDRGTLLEILELPAEPEQRTTEDRIHGFGELENLLQRAQRDENLSRARFFPGCHLRV